MDYAQFVKATEALYLGQLPQGTGVAALPPLGAKPAGSGVGGQVVVLIVAPHPDDECLMGSYALRMKLEWGARVIVYPYSLGSKKERQSARLSELQAACKVLGFELRATSDLLTVVEEVSPDFIFSPHSDDGHATHLAAHEATRLAMNVYLSKHTKKAFQWIQTEFWHAMKSPNLLIPLNSDHVALLGLALLQHQGEVARNPYHLRLPAWFMDQVRRGSEQVGGMGTAGNVAWVFGQLYLRIEYTKE